MALFNSAEQLIGNTPLLRAFNLEKAECLPAEIYAKLEYLNPTGSIKDRAALSMILGAESKGLLKEGGTLIEPTSGNTGIGIASIGAAKGYKVIIVMPETMSVERQKLIKAYGAKIVLTPGPLGMKGAVEEAQRLQKEIQGSLILGQFDNEANAKAHYRTTGPEIYKDLNGQVDILVATFGTGGTITGAARYLKEQNPTIKVIGVEPASSPLLSKGYAGPHKIQGIGANFIPSILDKTLIDEIIPVENEASFNRSKEFAKAEGISVGISSGAALDAAITLAKRKENKGKKIAVILPDSGDRYMSTPLFD
ncbi:MAG: cysteine synthase A [Bacilli bacterium]|nr:cysteine synthase A [Bacilli bacterium]